MNPFALALLFPVLPAAVHYAFLWAFQDYGEVWSSAWIGEYLVLAIPVSMLFSAFRWTCFKAVSGIHPGCTTVRMASTILVDLVFLMIWLGCLSFAGRAWPVDPWIVGGAGVATVLILRWINIMTVLTIFLRTPGSLTQPIRLSHSFIFVLPICVISQFCLQGLIVALYHHLGPIQSTVIAYSGTLYLFYAIAAISVAVQCYFLTQPYPNGVTKWVPVRRP